MSELSGKHGLIIGVANKRSIAWAVAKAVSDAGARLAVTYQGERLEENVRDLAADLADPLILPLDVGSDDQIQDVASRCERGIRRPGLRPSRRGVRPSRRVDASVRGDVARRLPRRARHQRVLVDPDRPRDGSPPRKARRREHRHPDLPGQRTRVSELQRDGSGEGGARSVGPLSRGGSWRQEHPRQRDLGRPDQDARGVGDRRLRRHPAGL